MQLDHVFVFGTPGGQEADAITAFGLTESPGRVHSGQGTANRLFSFENGYLEVIWAANLDELRSPAVAPTRLAERAAWRTTGYSPFGVCLKRTAETDALFGAAAGVGADLQPVRYQPAYFPAGQVIEMVHPDLDPRLPCIFRLPEMFAHRPFPAPPTHAAGIERITRLLIGIPGQVSIPFSIAALTRQPWLAFESAESFHLTLQFQGLRDEEGKRHPIKGLPLTLMF